MFEQLLHDEVQHFIKNFTEDSRQIAFSGSPFKNIPVGTLIEQIEGRRKAQTKLPTWYASKGIIYPPKVHLEQTSSETTAQHKSTLVAGKTLVDITGGFGIDSYFFAKKFHSVMHFELQPMLSAMVKHNLACLQQKNISCAAGDALEGIKENYFDVIYADPSRRNKQKGKVFLLKDCEPNIPKHLDYLLERCNTLLIKTSPMLDISIGLEELSYVHEIHIVAVQNEVKELVWKISKKEKHTPEIHTINFTKKGPQKLQFTWGQILEEIIDEPKKYLYEPNAAILKSGGYNVISHTHQVSKLHKHSHLYTSTNLLKFPGRRFEIEKIIPYSKKDMRHGIDFDKANITTRNFPESVATLRKKWRLKEGGNRYLFFTTNKNNKKILLICSKIPHEK